MAAYPYRRYRLLGSNGESIAYVSLSAAERTTTGVARLLRDYGASEIEPLPPTPPLEKAA